MDCSKGLWRKITTNDGRPKVKYDDDLRRGARGSGFRNVVESNPLLPRRLNAAGGFCDGTTPCRWRPGERATTRPRVQVVVTLSEGVWRISMADRIAKSLGKLRTQANARWPGRNKASDGWIGDPAHFARGSASDHNPHVQDGSTGVVTAVDLTHDPNSGCDAGVLAEVLIASRDPRIKYIIWNRRIVSGDAGPSPWAKRHTPEVTPTTCTSTSP